MKPEHFKEFNIEHAKAGAPYCQRNGLAARVDIWDRSHKDYPLIGVRTCGNGFEAYASWSIKGKSYKSDRLSADSLVMLPLGMCEGKPVFVGDWIETYEGNEFYANSNTQGHFFTGCKWPRKAPVMPKFSLQISRSATNTPTDAGFSEIIAQYLLQYRRTAIEAYWKALDEFNEVVK